MSTPMTTPIYDFLQSNQQADFSRLHMPGHKGVSLFDLKSDIPSYDLLSEISAYDITEITGADELFDAHGIILASEQNTAALYDTKHTSFSAGGSTLCIQAMLSLVANPHDTVIAARNVHSSFINTCALLDINPHFVLPKWNDAFFVSGEIDPSDIRKAIIDCKSAKAVYITSPDYLGCISDIAAIAKICDQYHLPLIVDNAHGAHLKFMTQDTHPIALGATMCCDSAHKTLPVLTGGAYLHVSHKSNLTKQQVKSAMALFGSTSPSYLILMSLDLANRYLDSHAKEDFAKLADTVLTLEQLAFQKNFIPISKNHDPTKLTFDTYQVGITGQQLKEHFRSFQIEPEYTSERHVVLMLSPQNSEKDIDRIKMALNEIEMFQPICQEALTYELPKHSMSVRTALFGAKTEVCIDDAYGKIAAEVKIKCPPGVPIVIPGEVIDKNAQFILKKSSILTINVVK